MLNLLFVFVLYAPGSSVCLHRVDNFKGDFHIKISRASGNITLKICTAEIPPSGSQHASKKECRRDIHSGFETHEEGHTKSKTGAINGSTKWTLIQTKNFKKNCTNRKAH